MYKEYTNSFQWYPTKTAKQKDSTTSSTAAYPLSASNNLDLDVGCRPHVLHHLQYSASKALLYFCAIFACSNPLSCVHLFKQLKSTLWFSLEHAVRVRRSQQPTHCWNCTPQLWLVYLPLVSYVYALTKSQRHNRFPLDENINPAIYNTVCFGVLNLISCDCGLCSTAANHSFCGFRHLHWSKNWSIICIIIKKFPLKA